MTPLLPIVISNVVLATALALPALAASRLWKNRHGVHLLWVIVLAKLVTPALWHLPVPVSGLASRPSSPVIAADRAMRTETQPPGREAKPDITTVVERADLSRSDTGNRNLLSVAPALAVPREHREVAESGKGPLATVPSRFVARHWAAGFTGLWMISSAACCLAALWRVIRFRRQVGHGRQAERRLIVRIECLARRMGLRRLPDVRLLDDGVSPMVWPLAWRPMLLLPQRLVDELTSKQLDTVIAHELAHLVRRDEWVRFLEVFVTCLFWWNPVVWVARRELHDAEEDCCDALVVCSLPELRRQYGEALLRAAEMIAFNRPLPALASALGLQRPLKGRIAMILNHSFRRSASWQTKLVLLTLALAVLPLAAEATSPEGVVPPGASSAKDAVGPRSGLDAAGNNPPERKDQMAIQAPPHQDGRQTAPAAVTRVIRPFSSLTGADTQIAGHEQLRILDEEAWVRLWLRHTGQSGVPADYSDTRPSGAPSVDFEQCMVLAITESPGQMNSGIRIVTITEADRQLTVDYESMPYQAREATSAPGNAFGFFVIPRSPKEVVFRRNAQDGRSRLLGHPPVWEEVRRLVSVEPAPSTGHQQSQHGQRGNIPQILRSDYYPKLGNGLRPASDSSPVPTPNAKVPRPAINIGFAHDPGPGHYDGVVGGAGDVWNFVDIGTTAVDYLRSADGSGTPMTLKVSRHDGEWGIDGVSGIFHGYIYHNCQCVDLSATISGLPPGRYMVYVYAHGDAPDQNAEVELAVGPESYGRKPTLNDGSWKFRSKTLEEGVQYVRFPFTAEADQPVTITSHRAGSGYSMLNAIQIVPVDAGM